MNVMDAIRNRRSVRSYSNKPISEPALLRVQEALRMSPSACNYQPRRFIFVTDAEQRQKLAEAARAQHFIAAAPVIVVGVGLPVNAYKTMGGYGNSVDVDVAIALDHMMLAAVEDGLGTCWIGAFNEEAVKALLHIPAEAKVVALTPLGYPSSVELIRPLPENRRKSLAEVIAQEKM
jgi:nitroreductase